MCLALLVQCSDLGAEADSAGADYDGGAGTGGSGAAGGAGGSGGSGAIDSGLPPEKELESYFRSPVATDRFVWTANPDSGRVALVNAKTLEVRVVEAGNAPSELAALPSDGMGERAIVINDKSHDATLFQVDAQDHITARSAAIHPLANQWAISKGGRFAIAWTDSALIDDADPTDGFQDVTVLELSDPIVSTRLSVGYRPSRVFISDDETRAFVVTEPGISVIELAPPAFVSRDIPVSDDPLDDPAARDVTITSDGASALVRHDGDSRVGIVRLADGTRVDVTLSGPVTDLDLAGDGSAAVGVVRDNSEIFVLPLPGVLSDPTLYSSLVVSGETVGSVVLSPDGGLGLLYTNAVPDDHLTLVNLAASPAATRTVSLKSPVLAVFPAPDAEHAVAFLSPAAGSSKRGAFSLIPTAQALPPRIEGTDAPPVSIAIAPPPSRRAVISVRDDAARIHAAYVVRFPELNVERIPLASPALATGIVPMANMAYVAQEHPEGRITFVDLGNGQARTLTGFELGAKVVGE